MGVPYSAGQVVMHKNRATVGGAIVKDTQVMGASEDIFAFVKRVNEMATLCKAAIDCRDATMMTALQVRINAIDD